MPPKGTLTWIRGTRKIEVSQANKQITNEMSVRKLAVFASLSDDTVLELQPLVSELGLTTVFATDHEEALRLVNTDDPGLVVAEAGRSDFDASKLCARLRRESPNPNIPIILIGAGGGRENQLAALRAGADEFFAKPLDPEDTRLRLRQRRGVHSPVPRRAKGHAGAGARDPAATVGESGGA